jgi:site-specific recombinase XerD
MLRLAKRSPRTVEQRVMVVRLIERHAGRPAEQLDEADLDAWQGSMGLLSPATRRSYISQAQCYYRWLHKQGLIESDPSVVLVRPDVPPGLPHPIRESDLELALRRLPHVVRVWLALAAYAGLRASEIAGLRREDLLDDQPRPMIRVTGKGGRERAVPLSPGLWKILLDFGLPSRGVLFRRADGRPETGKHISATANRWLRRLSVRYRLHSGRHRFASALLAEGEDIRVIQVILGHRSLASTQVYTLVEPGAASGAVAAIDHPLTGDDR